MSLSCPQVLLRQEDDRKPPPQTSTMNDITTTLDGQQRQSFPLRENQVIDLTNSDEQDKELEQMQQDVERVRLWIKENYRLFERHVMGPLKDVLTWTKPVAPVVLQDLYGREIWNYFIVQSVHDCDLLRRKIKHDLGLTSIPIATVDPNATATLSSRSLVPYMECFLDQAFQGPAPALQFLRGKRKVACTALMKTGTTHDDVKRFIPTYSGINHFVVDGPMIIKKEFDDKNKTYNTKVFCLDTSDFVTCTTSPPVKVEPTDSPAAKKPSIVAKQDVNDNDDDDDDDIVITHTKPAAWGTLKVYDKSKWFKQFPWLIQLDAWIASQPFQDSVQGPLGALVCPKTTFHAALLEQFVPASLWASYIVHSQEDEVMIQSYNETVNGEGGKCAIYDSKSVAETIDRPFSVPQMQVLAKHYGIVGYLDEYLQLPDMVRRCLVRECPALAQIVVGSVLSLADRECIYEYLADSKIPSCTIVMSLGEEMSGLRIVVPDDEYMEVEAHDFEISKPRIFTHGDESTENMDFFEEREEEESMPDNKPPAKEETEDSKMPAVDSNDCSNGTVSDGLRDKGDESVDMEEDAKFLTVASACIDGDNEDADGDDEDAYEEKDVLMEDATKCPVFDESTPTAKRPRAHSLDDSALDEASDDECLVKRPRVDSFEELEKTDENVEITPTCNEAVYNTPRLEAAPVSPVAIPFNLKPPPVCPSPVAINETHAPPPSDKVLVADEPAEDRMANEPVANRDVATPSGFWSRLFRSSIVSPASVAKDDNLDGSEDGSDGEENDSAENVDETPVDNVAAVPNTRHNGLWACLLRVAESQADDTVNEPQEENEEEEEEQTPIEEAEEEEESDGEEAENRESGDEQEHVSLEGDEHEPDDDNSMEDEEEDSFGEYEEDEEDVYLPPNMGRRCRRVFESLLIMIAFAVLAEAMWFGPGLAAKAWENYEHRLEREATERCIGFMSTEGESVTATIAEIHDVYAESNYLHNRLTTMRDRLNETIQAMAETKEPFEHLRERAWILDDALNVLNLAVGVNSGALYLERLRLVSEAGQPDMERDSRGLPVLGNTHVMVSQWKREQENIADQIADLELTFRQLSKEAASMRKERSTYFLWA